MNESFQDLTKEELKALDATRKIRDNEVLKYVVAAFDRLSTALLVVGFLGPIVGMITNPSLFQHYDWLERISVFAMMIQASMVSYGLHLYGRTKLRNGWQ